MSQSRQPPRPDGLPVLGHGMQFARDPFGVLPEWARYGDVVYLDFPGRSQYMVTEPELIQQVLVEQQSSFSIGRQQRETFENIEDDAVTATTGERWRRLRTALQPAFAWDGIRNYGDDIAEITAAHVDEWSDGDRFDLVDEMRQLTLHVIGQTLLGVDVSGDEAVVFEAADALVAWADFRRPGHLLPDWVPTLAGRRFERATSRLDEYLAGVVEDGTPGEGDVRSVLLAARERGDLSMDEVCDNLTGLVLAGHDTTAVALTYAWDQLHRNPAVRDRVAEEVATVVDGDCPTMDDFEALAHTERVVRETLRLFPPTWAVSRQATEPVTIGDYEFDAGDQLMLPQWVVHRDERFWENPETFDPTRWERDSDRPEYAYFPFSGGPRHCIGMRFARLELVLALATMLDRVTLDVSRDGPLTFVPSLSLRPETDIAATVRRH